jgi:hypothetical protein
MKKENIRMLSETVLVGIMALTMICSTGCRNVVAWRGVVNYNEQNAELEGKITNRPSHRDAKVEAEKNTDLNANLKKDVAEAPAQKSVETVEEAPKEEAKGATVEGN